MEILCILWFKLALFVASVYYYNKLMQPPTNLSMTQVIEQERTMTENKKRSLLDIPRIEVLSFSLLVALSYATAPPASHLIWRLTMENAVACIARAIFKMESRDYEGAFNLLRTSVLSLTDTAKTSMKLLTHLDSPKEKGRVYFVSSRWQSDVDRFYSGSFLFSNPSEGAKEDPLSKRQLDFCSAACLFNMALACHLECETSTDCRKRNILLTQSRTLYLTSYELLQKYSIQPTDSVVLLLMALCANLMDVEMELGSLDEVRFWRRILEDASYAADPLCFQGTSVFTFFDAIYIAPGELIASKAA